MGQSLANNYLHIIFSTKYRQPFITKDIDTELYSYLGGICKNLECHPIQVGGHRDHVHILCMLSKKIALMNLLKDLKASSSTWIKTRNDRFRDFYWQDGYGAFSVNPAQVDIVQKYILNQEEHHAKKDFKTEYRYFLKKYKVEYNEEYVWD
jgi:REP element-mobilizing transposase RayT